MLGSPTSAPATHQLPTLSSPPASLPRTGSGGGLLNERDVVRRTGKEAISSFLESHTCFSVLRASGKVVVFDTRIPIQLAFYALVEHGTFFLQFFILNLITKETHLYFLIPSHYTFGMNFYSRKK